MIGYAAFVHSRLQGRAKAQTATLHPMAHGKNINIIDARSHGSAIAEKKPPHGSSMRRVNPSGRAAHVPDGFVFEGFRGRVEHPGFDSVYVHR